MNTYNFDYYGTPIQIEAETQEAAQAIFDTVYSTENLLIRAKGKKNLLIKNIANNLLSKTDWKELRHYRQKYLEITTSLTEEEFEELLEEREAIRVNSNTLEAEINACTTISEVEAITWA